MYRDTLSTNPLFDVCATTASYNYSTTSPSKTQTCVSHNATKTVTMAEDGQHRLQFKSWSTAVELPFYSALAAVKIDQDMLNVPARPLTGRYEIAFTFKDGQVKSNMILTGGSFRKAPIPKKGGFRAEGVIRNYNTKKDMMEADTRKILEQAGRNIWEAIQDGTIYSIPSLLASFTMISYADLKKYTFRTLVGYPAFNTTTKWKLADPKVPFQKLTREESESLTLAVASYEMAADERCRGFFIAKKAYVDPKTGKKLRRTDDEYSSDCEWVVKDLREYENGFFKDVPEGNQYFGFADPSTDAKTPSWILRNYLVLIQERLKLDKVKILCYREVHERRHESRSIILDLDIDKEATAKAESSTTPLAPSQMPPVVGWEQINGKYMPRTANMATHMDPLELANSAVDLNLKLMKWRVAPTLSLDRIKETKCLLLGAGTLGSYVSRNLMGWGVRNITFVDYGKVSFSNPVRQPLFEHKDCLDGGQAKATCAAEALRRIYPGVRSKGYDMTVPMLGHALLDEIRTKQDFQTLQKLIEDHDAIFLLMDSRESRWLPTLMGKAATKLVFNAALGFDSYVAMRHGMPSNKYRNDAKLGCYFCNDVVAPADSMKNQTLDQQCTVTRPGLAPIASATLVELFVSVLQHPDGAYCDAPHLNTDPRDPPDHPLGIVPHQIRGYLASWNNMTIRGQSYEYCSACSDNIVDAYKRDGWEFVKKALQDKDYITQLSGLAEVQRRADEAADDVDWDTESEDGSGDLEKDMEAVML